MNSTFRIIDNGYGMKVKHEKCVCCKKNFYRTNEHIYKIPNQDYTRIKWFCTWGCLQKYRREHAPKRTINSIK